MEAGDGTDNAMISDTSADEIFALLGSGIEEVLWIGGTSARRGTFDGGPGIGDRLTSTNNAFTNQPSMSGFEET